MSPIRFTVIKQRAKEIEKLKGLKWTKALDEACQESGFSNYRHYLKHSKSFLPSSIESFSSFRPKNLSELINFLKKSSTEEVNERCKDLQISNHVQDYLIDLFQKRYLTVGVFIPNDIQKLKFDFQKFSYGIKSEHIKISSNVLISITTPTGELYESMGAMKTNNQFDCIFEFLLNSDSVLSLAEDGTKIIGRPF